MEGAVRAAPEQVGLHQLAERLLQPVRRGGPLQLVRTQAQQASFGLTETDFSSSVFAFLN